MEKLENEDLEVVSGGAGETYQLGDKYSYHCMYCNQDVEGTVVATGVGYVFCKCDDCNNIQRVNF